MGELLQLTRRDTDKGPRSLAYQELADPSPPYEIGDGRLRIYGSGGYALEYRGWDHLLSGGEPKRIALRLLHPDGRKISGLHSAWDINIHRWEGGREVLYAGVMLARPGDRARWPHDNWTRRVFAFLPASDGAWLRQPRPVWGDLPTEGWLGHCYGHQIATCENGDHWIFYERVTEESWTPDRRRLPYRTEIFARRMETPLRAGAEEIPILGVGSPPLPVTARRDCLTGDPSGYLVEGGRPVRVEIEGKRFFLLGFSAGDFPTDRYGIHVAWSKSLLGPYEILRDSGSEAGDVLDLGARIRRERALSWGPARPAFFRAPDGTWRVLFHAVEKALRPGHDYSRWPKERMGLFYRSVFLARMEISLSPEGTPVPRIF